jgi:hypothetical protein
MNILISTTIGYNLGDEIICLGVKNLLKHIFPEANYFIYNRNPDLWHGQYLHGNYINKVADFIDLVVLAGTPEFYLEKMHPLYQTVGDKPIWAIGIGWGVQHLMPGDVLKNALLKENFRVIARSKVTQNIIGKPITILPCPSLLSAFNMVHQPKSGACFVGDVDHAPASRTENTPVLCYTIEEFKKARNAMYFTDASEFLTELMKYEVVATSRLHAGLGAMACGCYEVRIRKGDFRIDTAMDVVDEYLKDRNLFDLQTEYLNILSHWKNLDKL